MRSITKNQSGSPKKSGTGLRMGKRHIEDAAILRRLLPRCKNMDAGTEKKSPGLSRLTDSEPKVSRRKTCCAGGNFTRAEAKILWVLSESLKAEGLVRKKKKS